jgi:heme O synthase-like polyprenyltransferase
MRSDTAVLPVPRARSRDFVALAKPRLNVLVVASTLAGYAMADGEALGPCASPGCCSERGSSRAARRPSTR